VWDVATGQPLFSTETGGDIIFSPDGRNLAVVRGMTTSVLDAATGAELYVPLSGHTDAISQIVFSPDGRFILTASWDKTVRIWNAQTGEAVGTPLSGHTAVVHAIAFSLDGTRLATASADRTVKLWDFGTGQELLTLYGHTERIWDVAFSPDGTRLASLGDDVTVRVYVLPIEELEALARSRVTRALTVEECDKYRIIPCPGQP
jgi:WD40 repeat protein